MSFDRSKFLKRYLDDAFEHLENLNRDLLSLEKKYDTSTINDLFRTAHTFKGTSRMMKQLPIAQIAHRMEDIFDLFRKTPDSKTSDTIDHLLHAVDVVSTLLKSLASGETIEQQDELLKMLENIVEPDDDDCDHATTLKKDKAPITQTALSTKQYKPVESDNSCECPPDLADDKDPTSETIRIHVKKLDGIVKMIDGIISVHNRLKQRWVDVRNIERAYSMMISKINKHWICVDATQSFAEAFPQSIQIQEQLKSLQSKICEDVNIGELLATDFRQRSLKMRMMPLSSLFNSFHRPVRDMAKQLEKKIEFIVHGQKTELDKKIIERLEAPLMHMIRNSIDHGIELPEIRKQKGKSDTGKIVLSASYQTSVALIRIQDDGQGIIPEKIKEKVLTQKLIPEAELKTMTQSQMINTIFVPGFTTSEIITDISGRGMGLDIVKQTIVNELKGTVRIDSNSDAGCTFEIRLPLTMAVMHLLTVKVMGAHFAIPSVNVDEIIRIPSTAVICVADKEAIQVRDALIPIVFLRDILKLSIPRSIRPKFLIIVIVQVDDEKLGLIVDELIDESTFVIKSLPDHLQNNQWITGVVISGNNDIVNILHIPKLIEETGNDSKMQRKETISQKIITPHILVVDDSFSTREIEKSILESYGYDVSLASDGAEAYGMTQSNQYDLVLTDIEMPAMNGFELTQKLRQSDRYAQTPIVLLTSMDQAEHKKRGISAGANAYIVKGDFDQSNLLDVIEGLLAGA